MEISQIVAKLKLLYLARVTALTSIIYRSLYNGLVTTNRMGDRRETASYHVHSNLESSKLYLNLFSLVARELGFFTIDTV